MSLWKANELEALLIRDNRYVVRPIGQLGTMGWYPRAWTAVFVTAANSDTAIKKALRQTDKAVQNRIRAVQLMEG